MTKDEEIKKIEDALDVLLTAALDHERNMQHGEWELEEMPSAEEMAEMIRNPPPELCDWIIKDPKGGAFRLAIHQLGQRLFQLLGNTPAMVDIAERVADRDTDNYGQRIDIIDKRWDGIGSGNDIWAA